MVLWIPYLIVHQVEALFLLKQGLKLDSTVKAELLCEFRERASLEFLLLKVPLLQSLPAAECALTCYGSLLSLLTV